MGYANLENNRAVTYTNVQNAVDIGVFTATSVFPSTNKCITKSEAPTLINIDTTYAPYAAKASNQLVVKSDLKPIFQNTGTFYYDDIFKVQLLGWGSSILACNNYLTGTPITIYWNGTLGVGTLLFITGYGSFSNYFAIDFGGTIYSVLMNEFLYYDSAVGAYACTVNTISTCVYGTAWQARYSAVFGDVCFQPDLTVYTSGTFNTGDTVYTDISLTIPLTGYNYISEQLSGVIYNIDSGTGVIGSSTFTTC